jgi:copper chaperone
MSSAQFSLRIDGMHCGACVRRVTQALSTVAGLKVVEVRIGAARVESTLPESPVAAAIAALGKIGFNAHLDE